MKKLLAILLALVMAFCTLACTAQTATPETAATEESPVAPEQSVSAPTEEAATEQPTAAEEPFEIVLLAKLEGHAWFDDMRTGVDAFAKDYNVNAYQIAPEGGDPAKQAQMMEDLVAKGVDAIVIVPNDPQSMVQAVEKAKAAGIVVVAHEAMDIANLVDYDMESFDNDEFGRTMYEGMAKAMNYEGEWTAFVGALTMTTHMQWFNAGLKYIEENYPNMTFVGGEPYEDNNDTQVAHDKTLEILKAYPNIKGIADGASSAAGISQALQEKGRDDVKVACCSTPSMVGEYVKNGYMAHAQSWRPADAGYVSCLIALKLLQGEQIEEGVDLVKAGYESCQVDQEKHLITGNAQLVFTADNMADYPY